MAVQAADVDRGAVVTKYLKLNMNQEQKPRRVIFAAGEVGTYVLCPESWRLKYRQQEKPAKRSVTSTTQVSRGQEAHRAWTRNFDEALFLKRNVKLILALILLAIAMYIILHRG